MFRLASIIFSMVATTLAGAAVVVALTMGYDTLQPILIAAGLGALSALPASYIIAKMITGNAR